MISVTLLGRRLDLREASIIMIISPVEEKSNELEVMNPLFVSSGKLHSSLKKMIDFYF